MSTAPALAARERRNYHKGSLKLSASTLTPVFISYPFLSYLFIYSLSLYFLSLHPCTPKVREAEEGASPSKNVTLELLPLMVPLRAAHPVLPDPK